MCRSPEKICLFSDDHTFIGSFHQILGENTSKDTYNAEWKISGIQYSPEEAKNGNMYIYFSEPLEFQIETPVQSDGTVLNSRNFPFCAIRIFWSVFSKYLMK